MIIPFGMKKGTIVKTVEDGLYAVLANSEDDWNDYMKRIEEQNLFVDYSDIQVVVYRLTENGHWSHDHINPMYLEPEIPEVIDGDEESQLFVNALMALSKYLEEESEINSEQVIKTARAYAEKKGHAFYWAKIAYEAKSAGELLG